MMKDTPHTNNMDVKVLAEQPMTPSAAANSKKKWLWMGLAAFAVVAAACITTGVVVSQNNNNKDDDSNEKRAAAAPTFSQSKAAIDLLCGTDSTKAECEAECSNVPTCCSIGSSSCLISELEGCVKYAKCQVLQELEEAAPANLADLCAREDKAECTLACKAVFCCYSDTEECDSSLYFLTCLDYAPCQVLKTVEATDIVVAPVGLDEDCALNDSGDRDACETSCDAASCCWGNETTNCLQENWVTCLTYAACGSLILPEANTIVQKAPSDLYDTTCNLDELWGDGSRDACETICEEAACCVANSTEEVNCFADDPIGCLEYVSCALLPLTGGNLARAPEDLSEICSWQTIGDATMEQACSDACQPAKCCTESGDDACLEDGNALTCLEYAPCAVLIIVGGDTVQEPPPGLEVTCARTAFEADPVPCESMCSAGAGCCYAGFADNCLLGNLDKCAMWTTGGCWRTW
jgi:hypothetical protein